MKTPRDTCMIPFSSRLPPELPLFCILCLSFPCIFFYSLTLYLGLNSIPMQNRELSFMFLNSLFFSHSVVFDSLQPHRLEQARLPCHSLSPEFPQTHGHWVDDAIHPSYPLLPLLFLPWIFPSFTVFPSGLALHISWPKDWSFSFRISPSNEHSGLISFRIDWFDLLAVQGTLKHLLQHHSSKASSLWRSAFLMVQLSHHIK